MREAASLAPDNVRVKEAFEKIREDDSQHSLLKLCSKFALEGDEDAGNEALRYLNRSAEISGDVAQKCVDLMIKGQHGKNPETQDGILIGLLRESTAAKAVLARRLQDETTNILFEEIYGIGDGAANGIVTVVLDPAAWSTEAARETCERGIFQLYLAKLMEVGDEKDGKAMKGVSRLLAVDAARLHELLDEDTFDAILSCLDYRKPADIRSQATLATAKYLEASESKARNALTIFVTTRVAQQKNEDLVLAFSAAGAVFPVATSIASTLFLIEGFVPSLVPLLEKKAKSEKVELAALDMLSAACIDSACRETINKHCKDWLQHVLNTGEGQKSGLAAVVLAKLQTSSTQNGLQKKSTEAQSTDLAANLQRMLIEYIDANSQSATEGLAYASVQPKVKEQLANDQAFLLRFLQELGKSRLSSSTVFGGLTLIDNLTRYLPNLSEEQKKLSQLKAYANASKPSTQSDPADEDSAVTLRCKAIVNAGAITTLVGLSKSLSPASLSIVFNILLSLCRNPANRGIVAQQGGARLLLLNYTGITGTSATDLQSRRTAAHALARILISVNPSLVFPISGSLSLVSTVRPIVSLLTEDPRLITEGPRDLLPAFEALLALTDLASVPSSGAAEAIVRLAFTTIETLLLSSNTMIQRASTELVCNLVQNPSGIELFADGSEAAARRMHILLAFADAEDLNTRKAAGGALATLTEFEGSVKAIIERKNGMALLLGLCDDDDDDIVHRGVVSVGNISCLPGKTGQEAVSLMRSLGVVEKLKNITSKNKRVEVKESADMALKSLNNAGE